MNRSGKDKNFIFTITAGRTGTTYLASLLAANLKDAKTHHEIIGYEHFGIDTPDLSYLILFNSQGNTKKVRDFWQQKLKRIANTKFK